ncbi:unnamed protein product [Ambrosiozyma monospora]|uniref:Unnamed protein product n=1 Tax=Ambrosiozyma monospora TaxID=43982 RepID=A0A9W6Z0D0_AMBMO|nr:unnamed protein product [Ambrosiozyma monospora]
MPRKVTSKKSSFGFEQKDLFSNEKHKKKTTARKKFSLLDDFEADTTLDDIFQLPSSLSSSSNSILLDSTAELKPEDKVNILGDDLFSRGTGDAFDFERYLNFGLNQICMPTATADLDFSRVKKTTIPHMKETDDASVFLSQAEEDEEENESDFAHSSPNSKVMIHGLLGNLSLEELDMQARSSEFDPFADHHDDDEEENVTEPELKNFLASSPEESNIMLDEIFDQPDDGFNNLEFDNIDENDHFIEEDEEPLVKHTSNKETRDLF